MDITELQGQYPDGLKLLDRVAQQKLRAACGGRKIRGTVWKQIEGRHHEIRLVRTKRHMVGVLWNALGEYPPRGCVQWMPIPALLKNYRPII